MFEIPEARQWAQLFAISKKIRQLEPWRRYNSSEIITIKAASEQEPIFCTILGAEEDYYGVSVFPSYADLAGHLKILAAGSEPPLQIILQNQSCVNLYFGEKDILSPGDRSAMEYGEYLPEPGPLNQIFFRTYTPGLAPWYINAQEAGILIRALNMLYDCLTTAEAKVIHTKKASETLYFTNAASGNWHCEVKLLPSLETKVKEYLIHDELFLGRLKRLPRVATAIELESAYVTSPVVDGNSPRPCFPRMVAIADHDEGTIEAHKILEFSENLNEEIISLLAEYIKNNGRPRLLIIRKNGLYNTIKYFCEKTGIAIEERRNLEIVDDFLGLIGEQPPEK